MQALSFLNKVVDSYHKKEGALPVYGVSGKAAGLGRSIRSACRAKIFSLFDRLLFIALRIRIAALFHFQGNLFADQFLRINLLSLHIKCLQEFGDDRLPGFALVEAVVDKAFFVFKTYIKERHILVLTSAFFYIRDFYGMPAVGQEWFFFCVYFHNI